MRISAIVAVHNGAGLLELAIDSILAQDPAPSEIIVIDDGSTDATPDVIRACGDAVRSFRQDNAGLSAAHNFALQQAHGDAIAFLDHDDLWPPGRLAALADALEANTASDIAAGVVEIRYERQTVPPDSMRRSLETKAHRPWMIHSLLIRRRAFDRIGKFDPHFTHGMDVDWYMRARDCGLRFAFVPVSSLIYRLHDNNMTRDLASVFHGILGAFKLSLDRRRQVR